MKDDGFWQTTPLDALSQVQWESLCDSCGLCCLHKLEDEDTGRVAITQVACKQLQHDDCRCVDYSNRFSLVPDCTGLNASNVYQFHWLPDTCAYRRVAEGRPLPYWHYLVSGDRSQVHELGVSARQYKHVKPPQDQAEWEDSVVRWVE